METEQGVIGGTRAAVNVKCEAAAQVSHGPGRLGFDPAGKAFRRRRWDDVPCRVRAADIPFTGAGEAVRRLVLGSMISLFVWPGLLLCLHRLGAFRQDAPAAGLVVLRPIADLRAVANAHAQASTLAILKDPSSFCTIWTTSPTRARMAGTAFPREMRPFLVIFVTWSWVGI